jgi:type IV fimbrial biogenesis protein FimT
MILPSAFNNRGFTLIELMVSLAVLAILLTLAVPAFSDFAQRTALRGVADNVTAVIADAKEEAIKRDTLVRVEFKAVGTGFCVGAEPVATLTSVGCDCSSTTACTIAQFPSGAGQLHSVNLDGTPAFGTDTAFVIDPKTAMLADFSDTGSMQMITPREFGIRVDVNAMGRPSLCTPSGKKAVAGVGACL